MSNVIQLGTLNLLKLTKEQSLVVGHYLLSLGKNPFEVKPGHITFSFEGNTYEFDVDKEIVARKRSHREGLAYEIKSTRVLGSGNFGTVSVIEGTGNIEIDGSFVVEDKSRVNKLTEIDEKTPGKGKYHTEEEIKIASLVDYLRVKPSPMIGGKSNFIMGELSGDELFDVLERENENEMNGVNKLELTPVQRIDIAINLCRNLATLHELGIIHRDIKPENVKINPTTNTALIFDFGTSKVMPASFKNVAGTLKYMAPEQFTDLNITNKVDVYALGLVLAELFRMWNLANDDDWPEDISLTDAKTKRLTREYPFEEKTAQFRKLGLPENVRPFIVQVLKLMTSQLPQNRCDAKTALVLFEKIKPIFQESIHQNEAGLIDSATKLAVEANQKLSVEKSLAAQLTMIGEYVGRFKLTNAQEKDLFALYFFQALNIEAFKGVKTIQDYNQQLDLITRTSQAAMSNIQRLKDTLTAFLNEFSRVSPEKTAIINEIKKEVDYILTKKISTYQNTIDDMFRLDARLKRSVIQLDERIKMAKQLFKDMDNKAQTIIQAAMQAAAGANQQLSVNDSLDVQLTRIDACIVGFKSTNAQEKNLFITSFFQALNIKAFKSVKTIQDYNRQLDLIERTSQAVTSNIQQLENTLNAFIDEYPRVSSEKAALIDPIQKKVDTFLDQTINKYKRNIDGMFKLDVDLTGKITQLETDIKNAKQAFKRIDEKEQKKEISEYSQHLTLRIAVYLLDHSREKKRPIHHTQEGKEGYVKNRLLEYTNDAKLSGVYFKLSKMECNYIKRLLSVTRNSDQSLKEICEAFEAIAKEWNREENSRWFAYFRSASPLLAEVNKIVKDYKDNHTNSSYAGLKPDVTKSTSAPRRSSTANM